MDGKADLTALLGMTNFKLSEGARRRASVTLYIRLCAMFR